MIEYPTIDCTIDCNNEIIAFDKLDGSNIRAQWSSKRKSFYKFGSRTQLIDKSDPILGPAIGLINEKYSDALSRTFEASGCSSAICFFEFYGPSSFAGKHTRDEKHDVVLFDVMLDCKNLVAPLAFIELTQGMHVPTVCFKGKLDEKIINDIRTSSLKGITFEGVVCKNALTGSMFKIKSHAWLDKLRQQCGHDETLYRKLA